MSDTTLDSNFQTTKNLIGTVNAERLYWVWCSQFLKTSFNLINLNNIDHANQAVAQPDPYTAHLSWSIYVLRLSLNLTKLGLYAIATSSMQREEKELYWQKHVTPFLAEMKLQIANDVPWSVLNFIGCFYKDLPIVPYLTVVGLSYDVIVNIVSFIEQEKQFISQLKQDNKEIKDLYLKKAALGANETEELAALLIELNSKEQALNLKLQEQKYNRLVAFNNITCSILLLTGFVICFTFPILGSGICLSSMIFSKFINNLIDIYKTKENDIQTNKYIQANKFTVEYSKAVYWKKIALAAKSLTLDITFPLVFTLAFCSYSNPVGWLAIVSFAAVAITSNLILNWMFKIMNNPNLPSKIIDIEKQDTDCSKPEHIVPQEKPIKAANATIEKDKKIHCNNHFFQSSVNSGIYGVIVPNTSYLEHGSQCASPVVVEAGVLISASH